MNYALLQRPEFRGRLSATVHVTSTGDTVPERKVTIMLHDSANEHQSSTPEYTPQCPASSTSEHMPGSQDPTPPDAPTAPSDMAILAANPDDDWFCEELLDWVRTTRNLMPNPVPLEDPAVIARLCALPDHRFTPTLIALAKPDCLSLDILFDERLLPRLARMRRGHLRGTFLPYARQLAGFAEHDFMRELRQAQQALQSGAASRGTPVVVSMDTVRRSPVTWLWWPYIAQGKLSMVDGDPGIGKSLLMTQLAANLSKGHRLPDQEGKPTFATGGPHVTVMLSTEDGLEDTLKPRLEDAGADCSKIKVLTGWKDANDDVHAFSFQDMPQLEKVLQEYDPRLVVIDPIQAYLGAGVDMHRANETRPLLERLRRLAEDYNCAIVCIRHPAKSSQGGKALHRGLGSVDFIGAARTGLFVEQHPLNPYVAMVAQSKSNIGPIGRTVLFSKLGGHFEWAGVSRLSAEMLGGSGRGPDPHAFLEACVWLEGRLRDGLPVASTLLREEAEEDGISFPTLRRAKKALEVKSVKNGDTWDWQLPAMRVIPQPTPLLSLASRETLEHVPQHQAVSGGTEGTLAGAVVPEDVEAQLLCGCGHAHAPGDCAPQLVENMKEAQEGQETIVSKDTPAPPPPPAFTPPRFCPSCHKKVKVWINRGTYFQCNNYKCPGKVVVRRLFQGQAP